MIADNSKIITSLTKKIMKENRRVSFGEHPQVEIHRYTIDKETRRNRWYDEHDYDLIRANIRLTIKVMETNRRDPESLDLCYRGLESINQRYHRHRKYKSIDMFRASQAIIDEQRRQRMHGIDDPDMLASVYHGFTIPCIGVALRNGRLDAAAAARAASSEQQQLPRRNIDSFVVQHSKATNNNCHHSNNMPRIVRPNVHVRSNINVASSLISVTTNGTKRFAGRVRRICLTSRSR